MIDADLKSFIKVSNQVQVWVYIKSDCGVSKHSFLFMESVEATSSITNMVFSLVGSFVSHISSSWRLHISESYVPINNRASTVCFLYF